MIPDIPRDAWRAGIEGWSEDILPYYRDLAPKLPQEATVVEVGTAFGRSAVYLAQQLDELGRRGVAIWCIDWWKGADFTDQIMRTLHKDASLREVQLLHIVRCDSARGARLFEDGSVDVCFIDADHSYDGMVRDLHAWHPKIKSGGILAGHDYSREDWPGVVQAVDEHFGGAEKIGRPTRTVWEVRFPEHGAIG